MTVKAPLDISYLGTILSQPAKTPVPSRTNVHRPAALVLHVLEHVGVAPEGHRGIGVAEHLRDGVQGHPLAQGQGPGGVAKVVEPDVGGDAGLLAVALEGAHR